MKIIDKPVPVRHYINNRVHGGAADMCPANKRGAADMCPANKRGAADMCPACTYEKQYNL